MFEGLVHDFHQKEILSAQGPMAAINQLQNSLLDPSNLINIAFNVDVKKDNMFRKLVYFGDFYLRLFK
jgi:hypothetical protein